MEAKYSLGKPGRAPTPGAGVWEEGSGCHLNSECLDVTSLVQPRGGFPSDSDSKESLCNAEDPGLIPGSGKAPAEGHSNPLQSSCLENFMDRGAWQATVYGSQRVGHD